MPPALTPPIDIGHVLERTLLLTRLGPVGTVPPRQARELTTLERRTLTARADDGRILAHRTTPGGNRAYEVSSLVDYLAEHGPVTLFDLIHEAVGDRLTREEYWAELTWAQRSPQATGKVLRVDRRPRAFAGGPAWAAWRAGHHTHARRLITEKHPAPIQHRARLHRGGHHHRLWVPELPLTTTGRFALEVLHHRAASGEQVGALPAQQIPHLERTARLPDLVVVEGVCIYHLHYDPTGGLHGARRISDERLTQTLVTTLDALATQATTVQAFQHLHGGPR